MLNKLPILLASAGFALSVSAAPQQVQLDLKGGQAQPVIPPGTAGRAGSEGAKVDAGPALRTTVAEIMENPRRYVGKNVIVTSRAEEIFTPWSFKLDERSLSSGGIDSDILVIGKTPLKTMGFDKSWLEQKVTVTGTVRILQAADFRTEYGRGVEDVLLRRYEGKPALVAVSVEKG